MTRRFVTLLLALAALFATAPDARAEDRDLARQLFQEATQARVEGRWDDARSLLARALDAYPQFSIGWNLVTAIERTGDLPEAERVLEWMRDGGVSDLADEERNSIAERLDEISPRLATLVVVAPAARGELEVDGDRRVALDQGGQARIRVNPGTHELAMVVRDGRRIERSAEVRAGATLRVRLEPPELATPVHDATPRGEEESRSAWTSPWLWIAVGALVVAGGLVAVLLSIDQTAAPLMGDFDARGL